MSTGLIEGNITDDCSCVGIYGVIVRFDLGGIDFSINGEYRITCPEGIGTLTAAATGYADEIIHNVTVHGGRETTVNFNMHR